MNPSFQRKFFLIALSLPFFLMQSCMQSDASGNAKGTIIPGTKDLVEIKIDPDATLANATTSSFIDSIRYVPLETSSESMFSTISQLEVTAKYYILWDQTTNCIYFFNKDGSFAKKITDKDKNLKIPFKKIDHFTVNEEKAELSFNDSYTRYVYFYNLEGEFIRQEPKPKFIGVSYASLGDYDFYFQSYDALGMTASHIPASNLVVTKDQKQSALYFPFDTLTVDYTDIYAVDQAFYNNQDGIFNFSRPYDYNIYSIDADANVENTFKVVLPPVRTVPEDFMSNKSYKNKRMAYTNSNHQVIYAITDFYRTGSNITFRLLGHSYNQAFVYSLKSHKLRSLIDYISDKSSYLLPFCSGKVHAVESAKNLISSVDAVTLFRAKLNLSGNPSWAQGLPASLKKFYQSDNLQNPVLTIFSLKQEI